MATGFLKVEGNHIIDENGAVVILRGISLGGSLNMENFLNGYPGTESFARAAMLKVMGKENYEYFFDRFLYHYFTEEDAKFLVSVGINSVRIPFSYKHFEDDMNPRVLKEHGFKVLDRLVDICSKHGIYSVLDMHTAPGCQNGDWHSDNHTSYAAFWDFKDHQDRTVWLWAHIAARYKDNTWVAGYNPLNEPCDPEQVRVAAFYERLAETIRDIDPNHMFFLDGNTFAMEWKGFDKVIPNSVYSIHDYSMMGFPAGLRYKGGAAQKAKLRQQYDRKCEFHHRHDVPVWVGEFGPTYESTLADKDEINEERYNLLDDQLAIYEGDRVSWSLWCYKDIGVMGMVSTSPDSPYIKRLKPLLEKKQRIELDGFTTHPNEHIDGLIEQLAGWMDEVSPAASTMYPPNWKTVQHVRRNTIQTFLASSLCDEFAECFQGLGKPELEEMAASWALKNSVKRDRLTEIISKYAIAST